MIRRIPSTQQLSEMSKNTMVEHLRIEFIEITEKHLIAKMPVFEGTKQPFGLLHGGASVALAETLGSIGASLAAPEGKICVGLEINANHTKGVREGFVIAKAQPIHIGNSTQVWGIEIKNEKNELVCISRITMAVLDKK